MDTIQSTSAKERHKHIAMLHTLDHLTRLIKVLREQNKVAALSLQERLMNDWYGIITSIHDSLSKDEELLDISLLLEQTSQQMAQARRDKRNEYYERSVANETELDVAVSKVDALFWVDRLVYHYWRAIARMAEFEALNGEK